MYKSPGCCSPSSLSAATSRRFFKGGRGGLRLSRLGPECMQLGPRSWSQQWDKLFIPPFFVCSPSFHSQRAFCGRRQKKKNNSPHLVAFGGKWNEVRLTKQSENTASTKKERKDKTRKTSVLIFCNVCSVLLGGRARGGGRGWAKFSSNSQLDI